MKARSGYLFALGRAAASVVISCFLVVAFAAPSALAASAADAEIAQRYVGGFVLVGARNVAFDVIVRSDGTAHSTWVEGPGGAAGEAGRWKSYGNGVLVEYASGWRDWLRVADSGAEGSGEIQQVTWKKGQSLLEKPYATARALPIDASRAGFVGVYSISPGEGEANIDITLQSSGRAFSNARGAQLLTPGIWWVEKGRALMIWADGWRNEFKHGDEGWTHQSWSPGQGFGVPPWRKGPLGVIAALPR